MQQDAHELLNFLLNAISEILLRHKKEFSEKLKMIRPSSSNVPNSQQQPKGSSEDTTKLPSKANDPPTPHMAASWVHELFEGELTNETKCLTCETVQPPLSFFYT
jgi:ubiquitin carboxyl-terminal hydrolase 12/46